MGAFKVLNAPVPAALQIAELKAELKETKDQLERQNYNKQSQNTWDQSKLGYNSVKTKSLLSSKFSGKPSISKALKPKSPKYEQGIARGKGKEEKEAPQAPTPNGAAEVTKLIAKMGSYAVEADPVYAERFQRLQQLNLHQQAMLKDMLTGTVKVYNDVDKKLKKPDKEQFTVEEILNLGHETDAGVQQAQLVSILRNMQRTAGNAMAQYWQRLQQRPPNAFPNANTYFIKNNDHGEGSPRSSLDIPVTSGPSPLRKTAAVKGVTKSALKAKPLKKITGKVFNKSVTVPATSGSSSYSKPVSITPRFSQAYYRPHSSYRQAHQTPVDGDRRSSSSLRKPQQKNHQQQQQRLQREQMESPTQKKNKKESKEDAYADLGSVSISSMIKTRKRSNLG